MRRTKIVCTIGPACETEEKLRGLILAGMNVARLNFSHSSHEDHARRLSIIRRLSEELKRPVAILQDLSGPKIRIGEVENGTAVLPPGERVSLVPGEGVGNARRLYVNYPHLTSDLREGDRVLLGDGQVELRVEKVTGTEVICKIEVGGEITSHKGINFPGGRLQISAMTDKDWRDLEFGLEIGVDIVALSFVRSPEDVAAVKRYLKEKGKQLPVVAKIEKQEAIDNLDEILSEADGAVVARGDLAVETALERVPIVQKEVIRRCNVKAIPVVTATQMLRSMVDNPRPTRAEATDVANAVLDGTDAVMLSEETAVGQYPVEAVQMMDRIVRAAEEVYPFGRFLHDSGELPRATVSDAISHAVNLMAEDLSIRAILTPTESGSTARLVARFRPRAEQIAVTSNTQTYRALCLSWGVSPLLCSRFQDTDEMIEKSIALAKQNGLVEAGDQVVVTAGTPVGVPGRTNLIRVETVR